MEKCYIYIVRNYFNDKVYIGYTNDLNARKAGHKYYAFTKNANTKFANALRKYGWENFTWEIIYVSWDSSHCLDIIEDQLICEYDSIYNGYNSMEGGFKGPTLRGAANGMFGKTHTDAVKQAQSERAKQRFTGKTYEDLYGVEKANELKQKRSVTTKRYMASKNCTGENNNRYNNDILTLMHVSGKTFTGTRLQINSKLEIARPQISRLIKLQGQNGKRGSPFNYRGWSLISILSQ